MARTRRRESTLTLSLLQCHYRGMDPCWTITELAAAAAAALGEEPARVNRRVRDLPNERLIRWYTTIGLVDPPSGRRGRTALYGERHLLQLVAVKRLQAAGRSIAEIQAELAGAPNAALREIARLPSPPDAPTPRKPAPGRRFWTQAAAAPQQAPNAPAAQPVAMPAVRLAPGVTLLLETAELGPADLAAIGRAAEPLLRELRRRGLCRPDDPASPSDPDGRHP
ncbi:putative transcriptional regulator, MerR family [Thermomonospora curvata DSM 43183]|uniref:Putative transcriptional regulator, MerR family n=2 Tax=Thermomonosporaceae TaxID=2012 RepID=D1A556_THECD|nr:putative transcriptional regulator, MerR family [Thermomonospora curvata DSM 43183]